MAEARTPPRERRPASDGTELALKSRLVELDPLAQRVTLEVAFFEGLSYPEIASRENVPLGTIKSRAARAIASLREALLREGLSSDDLGLRLHRE